MVSLFCNEAVMIKSETSFWNSLVPSYS